MDGRAHRAVTNRWHGGCFTLKKIDKPGFYCSCDTVYFNDWARSFCLSVKEYAPWAHVHFHVFDGTSYDAFWAHQNGATLTFDPTPDQYSSSLERKKDYWVNARFVRIPDIYEDSTPLIAIDADSLMVRDYTREEFDRDLAHSWVATAAKREQLALGSAVGFAADSARHVLAQRLRDAPDVRWYLDQEILDQMLKEGIIQGMDLKYSDFKMRDSSIIWTGKGPRKFKQTFTERKARYPV